MGLEATRAPLERARGGRSAREAFEACVRDALEGGPCVVSFSGGRDSSAVLATAVDLARREGHDPPIAVSLRFARVPSSEEDQWQRHVVTSLGVRDWECVTLDQELDLVGDVASREADRHGVLWPPNTHFHTPVAELARGGTLLTGFGGDEIMSPGWVWDRAALVLTRQVRPRPSDLLEVGAAFSPAVVRRARLRRRPDPTPPMPWLTQDAATRVRRAWRDLALAEPLRHEEAVRHVYWRSRYLSVALDSLALLARGHGAKARHPFADPDFVSMVAAERGAAGPRHRTREMVRLFGDLLPRETITRVGKATFNGAFFAERSRAVVGAWDGTGVDESRVDVDSLRRTWASADPDARTYPLLQTIAAQQRSAGRNGSAEQCL
ncbi:asparagine synthase-related protein [Nocardioides flavescens]|nr:asparagine synthase-related protein [Nocardioides flavescens]